MGSALSPREIQSRIRAGESLEEVANDAGVPATSIANFAGPVLAERRHITELARTAQVRRKEESTSNRRLGDVVAESLQKLGIDSDSAHWDAWRGNNKIWAVMVSYQQDDEIKEANFNFDQRGRYSTAANDVARDLIGDHPTPAPNSRLRVPDLDSEPTLDLNDELALVRVVQESADLLEITDYQDAKLEQVNGIYDIVRNSASDMDVLYEMLASFNEDSVNIYAGLMRNNREDPVSEAIEDTLVPEATEQVGEDEEPLAEIVELKPSMTEAELADEESTEAPDSAEEDENAESSLAEDQDEPEESQDFLPELTEVATEPTAEKPKPKRAPKKRASIPSWDEIMFGSPRPE